MLDNYFTQTKILGSIAKKSMTWLESSDAIRTDLDKALAGFNELPFAIQIFGGSGDKFTTIHPWHHLFFEAEQDLDSSILLLMTGFYKDSFRSLRSFLELHTFALYNFVNGENKGFQDWLDGKAHTPKLGELLKILNEKSEDFQALNKKLGWNREVELLYRKLSGFMHTQGALHTHTSLRNSNQTVFSEVGLKTGLESLLKALRLGGMGFVVNFPMSMHPLPLFDKFAFNPPAGGFLDEGQTERIKAIFPENISSEVERICMSNEDAASLAEGVRSMPDLSEKEVVESLKNTLEQDTFSKSKKEILQMVKNGDIGKAFALIGATQRAMTRGMTGVLFNPFYGPLSKRE